MKKFTINLFSNRFGIILATLNVCFFVSKGSAVTDSLLGKIFFCANIPAGISAILSVQIVKIFSSPLSFPTEMAIANTFFAFFIVAQWIFIAFIAKTVARKFRPTDL